MAAAISAAKRRRPRKRQTVGGFREGSGRKSLFPGKRDPLTGMRIATRVTKVAYDAVVATAEELTIKPPDIATAQDVEEVTFSDALEYLIRKGSGTPLE